MLLSGRVISHRLGFLHIEQRPHWGTQFKSMHLSRCRSKAILAVVLFPQRTGFQLMMLHVCMASLYLLSSVRTGGPSSKALIRIDVMQKQFLQLCCLYSIHRVSAHDAACLYGIVVYVEQRPHWRCHVCCMLCLTPGHTRYDTLRRLQFFATQCQGRPPFLTLFVYVLWLNRLKSKTVSAACLVHNALLGKWQYLINPCWGMCKACVYQRLHGERPQQNGKVCPYVRLEAASTWGLPFSDVQISFK